MGQVASRLGRRPIYPWGLYQCQDGPIFLVNVEPPYQLGEPWWQIRRPAPLLGEHNEGVKVSLGQVKTSPGQVKAAPERLRTLSSRLPLEGVRVADFSWAWAGPFCAMHLAHLGAEVIKIESQTHLDLARRLPFYPKGMKPGVNRCVLFNQWGQGKKSLLLNLT